MRLWHKDLITVLPNKMLVSQWRELSAIVGKINKTGTPNHRLVNLLMDYEKAHLYTYTILVYNEMVNRGLKPSKKVFSKIEEYTGKKVVNYSILYGEWHNKRYYEQCYYNLEEKYDRGIVSEEEWNKIKK